jgi:hypothetical protein
MARLISEEVFVASWVAVEEVMQRDAILSMTMKLILV